MLSRNEILQTIDMIDQQHLDIRTITMGVNLLGCCSTNADEACRRIYDTICRRAENLVRTFACEDYFVGIDDDNVIATINVWSITWFVLSAENFSNFRRKTTKNLVGSVNYNPLLVGCCSCCRNCFVT